MTKSLAPKCSNCEKKSKIKIMVKFKDDYLICESCLVTAILIVLKCKIDEIEKTDD